MLNPPPKQILMRLPRLYCTEDAEPAAKIIHLHFFIGNCDWFAAEFDGEDTFFGFAPPRFPLTYEEALAEKEQLELMCPEDVYRIEEIEEEQNACTSPSI